MAYQPTRQSPLTSLYELQQAKQRQMADATYLGSVHDHNRRVAALQTKLGSKFPMNGPSLIDGSLTNRVSQDDLTKRLRDVDAMEKQHGIPNASGTAQPAAQEKAVSGFPADPNAPGYVGPGHGSGKGTSPEGSTPPLSTLPTSVLDKNMIAKHGDAWTNVDTKRFPQATDAVAKAMGLPDALAVQRRMISGGAMPNLKPDGSVDQHVNVPLDQARGNYVTKTGPDESVEGRPTGGPGVIKGDDGKWYPAAEATRALAAKNDADEARGTALQNNAQVAGVVNRLKTDPTSQAVMAEVNKARGTKATPESVAKDKTLPVPAAGKVAYQGQGYDTPELAQAAITAKQRAQVAANAPEVQQPTAPSPGLGAGLSAQQDAIPAQASTPPVVAAGVPASPDSGKPITQPAPAMINPTTGKPDAQLQQSADNWGAFGGMLKKSSEVVLDALRGGPGYMGNQAPTVVGRTGNVVAPEPYQPDNPTPQNPGQGAGLTALPDTDPTKTGNGQPLSDMAKAQPPQPAPPQAPPVAAVDPEEEARLKAQQQLANK